MKICFHELEYQVEIFIVLGPNHLAQPHDIRMLKLLEKDDFSIGPLGVGGMLESIEYFFEGKGLSCFLISDFPDDSIGSASNFFEDGVSLKDVGFYFLWHFLFIN